MEERLVRQGETACPCIDRRRPGAGIRHVHISVYRRMASISRQRLALKVVGNRSMHEDRWRPHAGLSGVPYSVSDLSIVPEPVKPVGGIPGRQIDKRIASCRNWRSDLVHFMPAMMMRLFSTGVEHRAITKAMW